MALLTDLHAQLSPWLSASAWRVALSGGLDSSVLLSLLCELRQTHPLPPLSALHIHHGLQADAEGWVAHCQALCARLQVPLEVVRVQVAPGASLEAAARVARHAAFAERLGEGEALLLAQHRDDQAETLLYRLVRGAGVRGLAAMRMARPLGRGTLLRPLLPVPRVALEAHARACGLAWVEDPSNDALRFDRNFLRHRVLPLLASRWPATAERLAQAAAWQGEAQGLLDDLAAIDLAGCQAPSPWPWLSLPSLPIAPLRALSDARQRNLLRHWLSDFGALPDARHWAGWQALRDAREDAEPCWTLATGELRRGGGRIWWRPLAWCEPPPRTAIPWPAECEALALPGNGKVRLLGERPAGALEIRYRLGGERLQLPGRGGRDLKRLLNEAALPGFVRGRLPLLYRDGEPVAVANLSNLSSVRCALVWEAPGLS